MLFLSFEFIFVDASFSNYIDSSVLFVTLNNSNSIGSPNNSLFN